MLSDTLLIELVGVASAICLLVALWARPVGMFAVVFALAVVGAAVLVSWNDIRTVRADRAARAVIQQETAAASGVTVPPPNMPHSGS